MRRKEQTLGDSLLKYLRSQGLETPLLEYRITQAWTPVLGESISRYTAELYVRGGVLHAKIKSPALRQNLMMMHHELARKLNEYVGSQVITDVRLL